MTIDEISTGSVLDSSSQCSFDCNAFEPYPSSEKCGGVNRINVYQFGLNTTKKSSLLRVKSLPAPPTRPINIIPVRCMISFNYIFQFTFLIVYRLISEVPLAISDTLNLPSIVSLPQTLIGRNGGIFVSDYKMPLFLQNFKLMIL